MIEAGGIHQVEAVPVSVRGTGSLRKSASSAIPTLRLKYQSQELAGYVTKDSGMQIWPHSALAGNRA